MLCIIQTFFSQVVAFKIGMFRAILDGFQTF